MLAPNYKASSKARHRGGIEMFETSPVQKQDIDHIDAQLGTIIELLEKIILLLASKK